MKHCMHTLGTSCESRFPKTWKSIGDELVLCCRAHSLQHVAGCVEGFQGALAEYGNVLDSVGRYLDVKGSGWIAAFPTPNITVAIDGLDARDQFDEAFERRADESPSCAEFLGNAIDAGFRLGQHATPDRFVISAELAWLLAQANTQGYFHRTFSYHQRKILKGVLHDRPYPIVALDCERQAARKELQSHERQLNGGHEPEAVAIRNFLGSFMALEGIELPMVPDTDETATKELPKSYRAFATSWQENAKVEAAREAIEREGEKTRNASGGDSLPPEVEKGVEDTAKNSDDPNASQPQAG